MYLTNKLMFEKSLISKISTLSHAKSYNFDMKLLPI